MYPNKQTLRSIRKRLPPGGIQEIADKRKQSHSYISMVLSGARKDLDVIEDAIAMAKRHENRVAQINQTATA